MGHPVVSRKARKISSFRLEFRSFNLKFYFLILTRPNLAILLPTTVTIGWEVQDPRGYLMSLLFFGVGLPDFREEPSGK